MHIILLKFGANKSSAPEFMEAHNDWISQGVSEGVFHCVGSLDSGGGFILAYGENKAPLLKRIEQDPFVVHDVVTPEIHQIDVNRTTPELAHLTG